MYFSRRDDRSGCTVRESRVVATACLPMSVPRVNPYPWKFAMTATSKGMTHIYVLHETGDAGAHRVIYMDGRKHPVDPLPTWWGHSIGRWEGDTLVVDTIGYNDKFWFDSRGTPHTDKLHTIERFTRINYGTLVNALQFHFEASVPRGPGQKISDALFASDRTVPAHKCGIDTWNRNQL